MLGLEALELLPPVVAQGLDRGSPSVGLVDRGEIILKIGTDDLVDAAGQAIDAFPIELPGGMQQSEGPGVLGIHEQAVAIGAHDQ